MNGMCEMHCLNMSLESFLYQSTELMIQFEYQSIRASSAKEIKPTSQTKFLR